MSRNKGQRDLIRSCGLRYYWLHPEYARRRKWSSLMRFLHLWPALKDHAKADLKTLLSKINVKPRQSKPL